MKTAINLVEGILILSLVFIALILASEHEPGLAVTLDATALALLIRWVFRRD